MQALPSESGRHCREWTWRGITLLLQQVAAPHVSSADTVCCHSRGLFSKHVNTATVPLQRKSVNRGSDSSCFIYSEDLYPTGLTKNHPRPLAIIKINQSIVRPLKNNHINIELCQKIRYRYNLQQSNSAADKMQGKSH